MNEDILKVIERVLKTGHQRALSITTSGFLSDHPPAENLAKNIIQALEQAGYVISNDSQSVEASVATVNLT